MPQSATRKRVLANRQEITAAKYNIRTMVVDVLNTYDRLGCDNIGPTAVGTQFRLSFWCTAAVDAMARIVVEKVTRSSTNGQNYIARAARPPEFTGDDLRKVTLELRGRAEAVTFIVAYILTETQNVCNKYLL